MRTVQHFAPSGPEVVEYDRQHLALYAALLEAADVGGPWQDAAVTLMQLDVTEARAEECWRSHLERARWIIGEGLGAAIAAFGSSSLRESGASGDSAAPEAGCGERSAH
jgi:hypothetical protein